MKHGGRFVAAALIASQLSACSLLFVRKAPDNVPVGAWAECTESVAWPIVDAVLGVSTVASAVGVTGTADEDEDAARVVAPIYGLMGLAFLYSAYVGFRETSQCGNIHDQAEARGVYGPTYYPPPQPYPYPPPQPYPPQPQPQPQPAPPQP